MRKQRAKVGDYILVRDWPQHFVTIGKLYQIIRVDDLGKFYIICDRGHEWNYGVECINGTAFELILGTELVKVLYD